MGIKNFIGNFYRKVLDETDSCHATTGIANTVIKVQRYFLPICKNAWLSNKVWTSEGYQKYKCYLCYGTEIAAKPSKNLDYMCINLILEHSLDETVLDKICKGYNWWWNPAERNSDLG